MVTDMRARAAEQAMENYKNGLNCSEAVYNALIQIGAIGASSETSAMCMGFGGGIGLAGYTCGALSAAVMAVGAGQGRKDPWATPQEERGKQLQQKYYRLYNNLTHDFDKLSKGVLCRDICAPYPDWAANKDRRANCMRIIGETAALACDYLQMSQEKAFALPYHEKNMAGLK